MTTKCGGKLPDRWEELSDGDDFEKSQTEDNSQVVVVDNSQVVVDDNSQDNDYTHLNI